ncbi:hypothetical protein [Ovoidimarina sediminis]|uniref:hypothetical protein n=1 Tax=Ovoidimarina sediminis TaxID=3079856 RepID=UPI00290AA8DE|nr:hypothetical protein [Rhodophyticola sp. MJ-SS7]MDU8944793.1 hypothetical protein [Rhodophyticola sp. MJ-SS7]
MAKIVHDKPDGILIEDRPVVFTLIVGAATLYSVFLLFRAVQDSDLLLGLAALFLGGASYAAFHQLLRHSRLTLHPDGRAELWWRDLKGPHSRSFSPGTLRAGLESNRYDGSVTTRAVLLIDGGPKVERLPLSKSFSGSARAKKVVERIMDWREASGGTS